MTTLEKIRAEMAEFKDEIAELPNMADAYATVKHCLVIIDKYASEECDNDCEHCAYIECPKEGELMTREQAVEIIRKEYLCVDRECDIEKSCGKCDLVMPNKEPILQAYKMAMDALKQEPCEDNRLYSKVYADLEPQEKAEKLYQICGENELKEVYEVLGEYCGIEPCEDAVSRQAVLDAFAEYVRSGYADSENDFGMYCRIVNELPSVQPKEEQLKKARKEAKRWKRKYLMLKGGIE